MISKEVFTKAIKSLMKATDECAKVNSLFRELGCDSYYMPYTCEDEVVKLLEETCGGGDTISWWCYEADYGRDERMAKMWDADDNEIPMRTVDDLYNYLISQEGK